MMKFYCLRFLMLSALLFVLTNVIAQNRSISGSVISSQDEEPLIGVSVNLKGKPSGVQTDINGRFSLIASSTDVLVFSYMGFVSNEVLVGTTDVLNITLEPNVSILNEVVVVGYGTQKRNTLAGSVSSVASKTFQSVPNTNLGTALQGTVSGVRVQQTTGEPGAAPTISFRGGTEFNGTGTPLYVVDGIIVPNLNGISMNDVESIDLLKDAASTAIYGARASNGVVLVTTKRGKKGKTQVAYNVKLAKNYVRRNPVEYLNAADYISWNRQGLASRYNANIADGNNSQATSTEGQLTSASWGWALNPSYENPDGKYSAQLINNGNRHLLNEPGWGLVVDRNPINQYLRDSIIYKATSQRDFEDLILQESTLQDHYINFSGANDQGNFALGLGAIKDVGMVVGSSLKRLNMNFNGGLNVGKNLKVGLNLSGYDINSTPSYVNASSTSNLGGVIQRFGSAAPTMRLRHDITGEHLPGGDANGIANPLYFRDIYQNSNKENRFAGGINIEYTILPELKFLASGSGYIRFSEDDSFTKAYQNGSGGAMINTRNASFSRDKTKQYSYNAFFQYDKNINKHQFNMLGGGEYFEYRHYTASASANGAATDFIPWLSASTASPNLPSSAFSQWDRLASLIGRFNYNYDQKYLLNVNLRYDGTSRLDKNKYGLFPGISAGWNLHQEEFYKNSKVSTYISTIKPRLSWGQNGSINPLGYFVTDAPFGTLNTYDGNGAVGPAGFVNPDLKWERVSSLNMGLDIGLFQNRVTVLADYFVRNVYDKITTLSIPSWTGFSNYTTNLGQLQNKGIELELRANVIRAKQRGGFYLDLGANFTHVKNYAVKLPDNGLDGNRQNTSEVWNPVNSLYEQVGGLYEDRRIGLDEVWTYVYDGIYTNQNQLDEDVLLYNSNLPYSNKTLKFLGDARWRDVNEDGIIDSRDRVYVGRTTPTSQGGFSTSMGWKNFNLYAQFDYAVGFVIIDQSWLRGMAQAQGSANMPVDVKWTYSEFNTSGNLPRYYWANYGANYISAANYYQKGDYLSVREVTLSYDLPETVLKNTFRNRITGVRAYLSGSNLAYMTRYNGTFPEVGGDDPGRFPLPRRVTFGLNVNF